MSTLSPWWELFAPLGLSPNPRNRFIPGVCVCEYSHMPGRSARRIADFGPVGKCCVSSAAVVQHYGHETSKATDALETCFRSTFHSSHTEWHLETSPLETNIYFLL